jgi:hypothetical protein
MIKTTFEDHWGLLVFSLLLLFMGLFFQSAWQYPVVDSFPLIERLLDPTFLTNDFYTNTFSQFSPRLVTAKIIIWCANITDQDYTDIVAVANIIRIWLYGIGLYFLFLALSDKKTALIAFSFSALSFLSMPFLPAWWPVTFDFTSSNIALVTAMFAWVYAVKAKVHTSFVLLTITACLHPVVGLHSMFIAILIYISIHGWKSLINLLGSISIYPFAIAFAAVILFNYFSYEQVLSKARFIEINAQYRHAHHFIFSHMDIQKWISTLLMCSICIAIFLWLKSRNEQDKLTVPVLIYSATMILLGLFFTDLYPTRFMVSFIPMRAFPILVPIIILAIAKLAIYEWKELNFINFYLLFLPFLPYSQVGLTWYIFPDSHELILPLLITLAVCLIIVFNHLGWLRYSAINKFIGSTFKQSSLGIFILPIALAALVLAIIKFEINIPTLDSSPEIYSWVNVNVPKNDVIITELNAADNQKLRLLARRAVVVSKDFPFNELFFEDWYQKYSDIYIDRDNARGRIDALDTASLNLLLDKYQVQILIRSQPLQSNKEFELLTKVSGEKGLAYVYKNKSVPAL